MNKAQQTLFDSIRELGTEIYTVEQATSLVTNNSTHIKYSLPGLVQYLLANYSYSSALLHMRMEYNIFRVSKHIVMCLDKKSQFYSETTNIPNEGSTNAVTQRT